MSSTTVYRLSAIALLIGGALATVGSIVQALINYSISSALWMPASVMLFIGVLLMLLGLPAVYARQRQYIGSLGLIGFALFFIGNMLLTINSSLQDIITLPWISTSAPRLLNGGPPPALPIINFSSLLLTFVGSLIFVIATFRAKVPPRGALILIMASFVVNFAGALSPILGSLSITLYFVAFIWLGVVQLSSFRQEAETQPPLVPARTESPA
jgi:hypothetical protein